MVAPHSEHEMPSVDNCRFLAPHQRPTCIAVRVHDDCPHAVVPPPCRGLAVVAIRWPFGVLTSGCAPAPNAAPLFRCALSHLPAARACSEQTVCACRADLQHRRRHPHRLLWRRPATRPSEWARPGTRPPMYTRLHNYHGTGAPLGASLAVAS